jgi:Tol biopolymer transport system component
MRNTHTKRALVLAGLTATLTTGLTAGTIAPPADAAGTTPENPERVSVSSTEQQTAGTAPRFLTMSRHGRYVAFDSPATDLVRRDTNGEQDVFVRDRAAGTTRRVSVSSSGRQGDAGSHEAAISGRGRYVVFTSGASNLVRGDTNHASDVFVRDLRRGTTTRVSVGRRGVQATGASYAPSISANGRYVVFGSGASNLVRRDRNHSEDVFIRDLRTKRTSRVSVPVRGRQFAGPSALGVVSDNGRYVAFIADPHHRDGFDVYLRDRRTKKTRWVSQGLGGELINGITGQIAISGNGRYVGYCSDASNIVAGDTNEQWDAFVWNRRTATTRRVNLGAEGEQANGFSDQLSLSTTGRYVGFASEASNLVPDDNRVTDAFVRDLRTGLTRMLSIARGEQGDGPSGPDYAPQVALSDDGHHAAFVSEASNLVLDDTNGAPDVFAWDEPRER